MDATNQPCTFEVRALQKAYSKLNTNDLSGFLEIFSPQIERVEPPGLAGAEVLRGLEAVSSHFRKARDCWAEGACEPVGFEVLGDKVVACIHVKVRLKQETEWRDAYVSDAFSWVDGKVTEFRTFLDQREALAWAGMLAPKSPNI